MLIRMNSIHIAHMCSIHLEDDSIVMTAKGEIASEHTDGATSKQE